MIYTKESHLDGSKNWKCKSNDKHLPKYDIVNSCPSREGTIRGRFDHFIYHGPQQAHLSLPKSKLAFVHIARATGLLTPMLEMEEYGSISGLSIYQSSLKTLRGAIRKRFYLWAGIYSEEFMVAPVAWPQQVEEAFKLQDPPTPWETATALLMAPSAHFWGYDRPVDHKFKCAESILLWWLMGLPEEAMIFHLNIPPTRLSGQGVVPGQRKVLHNRLTYAISKLMTRRRFRWWALGSDLRRIAVHPTQKKIVRAYMQGTTLKELREEKHGKEIQAQMKALEKKPAFRAQITTGKRIGPLCRPIYRDNILWRTIEEKESWWKRTQECPPPGCGWQKKLIQKNHSQLREFRDDPKISPRPNLDWLILPGD